MDVNKICFFKEGAAELKLFTWAELYVISSASAISSGTLALDYSYWDYFKNYVEKFVAEYPKPRPSVSNEVLAASLIVKLCPAFSVLLPSEDVTSGYADYRGRSEKMDGLLVRVVDLLLSKRDLMNTYEFNENQTDFMAYIGSDGECKTIGEYIIAYSDGHLGKDGVFSTEFSHGTTAIKVWSHLPPGAVTPADVATFEEWFDKYIDADGLASLWRTESGFSKISRLRRTPTCNHEWLMVATTVHLKRIGVPGSWLKSLVTPTKECFFVLGGRVCRHGGFGSNTFHQLLRETIERSRSKEELAINLNKFGTDYGARTLLDLLPKL